MDTLRREYVPLGVRAQTDRMVRPAPHKGKEEVRVLRDGGYFRRMSFFTETTPFTPRATAPAMPMSALELTKPLSCTAAL